LQLAALFPILCSGVLATTSPASLPACISSAQAIANIQSNPSAASTPVPTLTTSKILNAKLANRPPHHPDAPVPPPDYARWGRIAVEAAATKYPNYRVVDYLHIGRRTLSARRAVEQFKLWMRRPGHEFGAYVDVTFDPKTNRLVSISFRETER
jgi:hypothetical protein